MNRDEKARMAKALQERYYMINFQSDIEKGTAEFTVTGSTGNVYKIKASKENDILDCDCPDFKYRLVKNLDIRCCKHGFFIQIRVLKNNSLKDTWKHLEARTEVINGKQGVQVDSGLVAPDSVVKAFERKRKAENPENKETKSTEVEIKPVLPTKTQEELDIEAGYRPMKPIQDEDCGICYESLETGKLTHCKLTCGKAVHVDCFERWMKQTYKPNCVYCRSEMVIEKKKPAIVKTPIKRQKTKKGEDEYINLQKFFNS